MAWRTPTNAGIAALIGARIDIVGILVGVIGDDDRREAAA